MTTTTAQFDLLNLGKEGTAALLARLGYKADWERVTLPEMRLILAARPAPDLFAAIEAAGQDPADFEFVPGASRAFDARKAAEETGRTREKRAREGRACPVDDLVSTAMTVLGLSEAASAAHLAAIPAPTAAAPTPAATPAPAVAQERAATPPAANPADAAGKLAALLAELLATGKAGLDADEVRGIVEPMLNERGALLLEAVEARLAAIPARDLNVTSERGTFKVEGAQHEKFETLLHLCAAKQPDGHRLNVWLYGPPGTGKTTAARNAAKALGLGFYCNGALSTKYELTGFVDAHGKLVRTPFRDAWESGGVYLFDEIDGSVAQAVVAFNAALANGVMAFPDGMIERHPDCVIVAAANTTGLGATAEFTGRMKLDAATLDRFVMVEWNIDEALEAQLCARKEWVREVQAFRRKVAEKGVKGVHVTPRATIYGASLLDQGLPVAAVRELVLRKGMSAQQWAMVA